jgi:sporulation protein YlmC with PRC-barrel domain
MSSLSNAKAWRGSPVITDETTNRIGWVKEIKLNSKNDDKINIIVVPIKILWLPISMTGACELPSNAVLIFGEDCLIVTDQVDLHFVPQNSSLEKIISSLEKSFIIILFLIFIPVILLLLPICLLFLIGFIGLRIYKKLFFRSPINKSTTSSDRHWDDEGYEGFSRVRQPHPLGPQPPDCIELEIPLVDDERNRGSFMVTSNSSSTPQSPTRSQGVS